MAASGKHLAVLGQPLAPQVVTKAQTLLTALKRNDITVSAITTAGQGTYSAIVYISSPEGTSTDLMQQVYIQDLATGGTAVIPIAREDAWLLAAFLKGQNIPTLTYGLGNAELVLHPNRAVPNGLDVTLKYNTLHSTLTMPVESESELVTTTAALALLVAGGIDVLDLLPVLTTA